MLHLESYMELVLSNAFQSSSFFVGQEWFMRGRGTSAVVIVVWKFGKAKHVNHNRSVFLFPFPDESLSFSLLTPSIFHPCFHDQISSPTSLPHLPLPVPDESWQVGGTGRQRQSNGKENHFVGKCPSKIHTLKTSQKQ